MAKFNEKEKVTNRSGYAAYGIKEKEQLVIAVLTSMFGEPKFYGETDSDIVRLGEKCAKNDPEFLYKLTCYSRNEMNLRSVSHVLVCIIARFAPEYTRAAIRNIIVRADDMLEIMACFEKMYGKPFPNAMKRELAVQIQNFDEYRIAKYNGGKRSITFKDMLRITHPVPKDKDAELLMGKIVDGSLKTPYTWETELSEKGNTKEVWEELIASGKVGYMALLRNLRNIIKSGADVVPVLEKISDPEEVKKSRQLPFRFYSAYRTLDNAGMMTPEIHKALDSALTASLKNMETIPGRTLIAVDVSGSMGSPISRRSDVRCRDIASLMGAMASSICEDATVCYFDYASGWGCGGGKGYYIKKYGKYDSVLDNALNNRFNGGGTDLSLPMKYALEEDKAKDLKPFDRLIYFSDNECNHSYNGSNHTVQGKADEYRRKYNPDFWVHAVDLMGYGTQQFKGKNFNLIAGWSDNVLPFILQAEHGIGTMVEEISRYQPLK